MEAAIVETRVIGAPEIRENCVTTVIELFTVAGAATGDNGVEVIGGKPRMWPSVVEEKADWVLDTLSAL